MTEPATAAATWDVYVVTGKRKPLLAGTISRRDSLPGIYTHEGVKFYFATLDMVVGTVTYVNVPVGWTG